MSVTNEKPDTVVPEDRVERRQFLERLGKYAAVTPPLITTMLTASTIPAHASGSNAGTGNGSKGRRHHRRRRRHRKHGGSGAHD